MYANAAAELTWRCGNISDLTDELDLSFERALIRHPAFDRRGLSLFCGVPAAALDGLRSDDDLYDNTVIPYLICRGEAALMAIEIIPSPFLEEEDPILPGLPTERICHTNTELMLRDVVDAIRRMPVTVSRLSFRPVPLPYDRIPALIEKRFLDITAASAKDAPVPVPNGFGAKAGIIRGWAPKCGKQFCPRLFLTGESARAELEAALNWPPGTDAAAPIPLARRLETLDLDYMPEVDEKLIQMADMPAADYFLGFPSQWDDIQESLGLPDDATFGEAALAMYRWLNRETDINLGEDMICAFAKPMTERK